MHLSSLILGRVVAIGAAAADLELSSATLGGVYVVYEPMTSTGPATLTIAATDSKILVEEVHTLDGDTGSEPWNVILSLAAWSGLKAWIKPRLGSKKIKPAEIAIDFQRVRVTDARTGLTSEGRITTLLLTEPTGGVYAAKTIDAPYPGYRSALQVLGAREPDAEGHMQYRKAQAVQGINLAYLARLHAAWGEYVRCDTGGRGWILTPLKNLPVPCKATALIMTATLPD